MPEISKDQIKALVAARIDPEKTVISDIIIDKADVYVTLDVDPADGPALEPMRQEIQQAVEGVKGVSAAHVVLTAERKPPPALAQKGAKTSGAFSHKISSRPVAPKVKYMIAVASGKGGVGKSTVAANLALAFHALGKKAGLLDADIYGASQPLMMGIREKPATGRDDMIVPLEAHGVKLISMGLFVDPKAPIVWRGPMVHSAIQQLFRDVDWGELDVLVIDLPPGTGDAQLSLAQYVPLSGAVIVSTPQDAALNEAMKGLRMFEKTNVKILGLIENMSGHICSHCGHEDDIFGKGTVASAAALENAPYLGDIPLVSAVREKSDQGTPIVAAQPDHKVSALFMNIASRIWMSLG